MLMTIFIQTLQITLTPTVRLLWKGAGLLKACTFLKILCLMYRATLNRCSATTRNTAYNWR